MFSVIRSILSILGLLSVGAGVCCGVFTCIAYVHAVRLDKEAVSAQEQVRRLEKETPEKQAAQNLPGWKELARENVILTLRKMAEANALLAVSLGLFLGGTALWLFAWGLRPKRSAAAAIIRAEPIAGTDPPHE
jgi:hypothetical protein